MISELLSMLHTRPSLSSSANSPLLLKITTQCKKLPRQQEQKHYQEQLEQLFTQYLFYPLCSPEATGPSIYQKLQPLHSPGYRLKQLGELPRLMTRLQYYARQPKPLASLVELLPLDKHVQRHAVHIANQAPFSSRQHPMIRNMQDMETHLPHQHGLMIICSALIKEHCLGDSPHTQATQMFQFGVTQAFIASRQAETTGGDALRAYMTVCCHLISLLLTQNLLLQTSINEAQLQEPDIQQLLPRLNYWIAKDLGLTEDILTTLRQRFQQQETDKQHCWISQSSHAALAFLLHQHKQFNRKQLLQFLDAISLSHLSLTDSLLSTKH